MQKELTQEQIKLIAYGIDEGSEHDGFRVIEEGEWDDDGKYQYREIIFEHEGKFWALYDQRSGSHFTDWYHSIREGDHDGIVYEVRRVTKTVHVWETVEDEA
jgi:hypothetical protein